MKRILIVILFFSALAIIIPQPVYAADCSAVLTPSSLTIKSTLTITVNNTVPTDIINVTLEPVSSVSTGKKTIYDQTKRIKTAEDAKSVIFTIDLLGLGVTQGSYILRVNNNNKIPTKSCLPSGDSTGMLIVVNDSKNQANCPKYLGASPEYITPDMNIFLLFENAPPDASFRVTINSDSNKQFTLPPNQVRLSIGGFPSIGYNSVTIQPLEGSTVGAVCAAGSFSVQDPKNAPATPTIQYVAPTANDVPPPCAHNAKTGLCEEFYISGIGKIGTSPTAFIQKIFTILLSLSGGVMLLILFYSGYRIMTSQGNKEALQDARERITSAIVGLLFLIFSFVILQIIGVDLLHVFKP